MNSNVLLAIFTLPSDLAVVKSLLESNGIESNIRDELTIQVHNFISNALGGIRMEVKEKDYARAKAIIVENGFESYLVHQPDEDHIKSKEPLVSSLKWIIRIIVILSGMLILMLFYLLLTEWRRQI